MSFLILLLFLLPAASARRYYSSLVADCVPQNTYQEGFRLFPDQFQLVGGDGVEVEVAEDFRVRYAENYKVVQNLRVNETYVLYQCGTQMPDVNAYPTNVKLFEIPLTNVALWDVTSSGFLSELGVGDRAKFVSGYATDPCLQKISHECGSEAQDPGSEFADERLLRMQNRRADAVFVSAASDDPKTVAFTATMDPAVLKRAEWIKFVSLFFNKEPEANRFFNAISATWERIKIRRNEDGPLVAWISYQDYDGKEFFIHFAQYKMELIEAAGGQNLDVTQVSSMNGVTSTTNGYLIEFERRRNQAVEILHDILKDVDIVIDETYQSNNTAYDIDAFYQTFGCTSESPFKFIRDRKVFRLDATIGNSTANTNSMDWYETGVSRPDLVLKDLQLAFGTQLRRGHKRNWLRNLSEGELPRLLTHQDCTTFKSCNAVPEAICPSVQVTCLGDIEYRNNTSECQPLICD